MVKSESYGEYSGNSSLSWSSPPLKHFVVAPDGVKIGIMEWRPKKRRFKYPLLFIHGYAQNNLSWHGRSGGLAPELKKMGFHVFSVDLRGSGLSRLRKIRYNFTFDDFVFKDVKEAVDFIRVRERVGKVVLAGHSLGGIVSYTFSAFFPDKVYAIITFGSPVHFGRGVPLMKIVAKATSPLRKTGVSHAIHLLWPRENIMKVLGFFGLFGIPAMRYRNILKIAPLYPSYTRNFESPYDFWEKLIKGFEFSSPKLLSQVLRWIDEKKITSWDGKVNFTDEFRKINQPIFALAGTLDKLAPPESVKPIFDIVSSEIKLYKEYEAGHLDIIEGKLAKEVISKDIADFLMSIEKNNGKKKKVKSVF